MSALALIPEDEADTGRMWGFFDAEWCGVYWKKGLMSDTGGKMFGDCCMFNMTDVTGMIR